MICEKCNTELPSHAVACWRCGTVLGDITFVKPIGNVEHVTYSPRKGIPTIGIVLITLLAVAALTIILIMAAAIINREKVASSSTLPPFQSESFTNPTSVKVETPTPTATPKPTRTPKPTPSPIDWDSEYERINRNANMQRMVNTPRMTEGFPAMNSQGKRLRAVCNNGSPSYWQGEKAFICAFAGGAKTVFW